MMPKARRPWIAVMLLASALHALGIARSLLPAQDGLKFLRVARAFQTQPWSDVVRGSDQHPLYPALVALAEPVVSRVFGHGPDAWRIAAQLVSSLAAVGLLLPLHSLARALFHSRVADLTALGFVLLPVPMELGHDTLSDALALCAFLVSLRLGLSVLRTSSWRAAAGCGLAAGVGFLSRPEALVVPVAVVAAGVWQAVRRLDLLPDRSTTLPRLAGVSVAFLTVVGGYALVKGEVSEKLALRTAAAVGSKPMRLSKTTRAPRQWLPRGLDDPRWDFSAKEEPAAAPRRKLGAVAADLALQWAEGLGWVLAIFVVWGLVRDRFIRRGIEEAAGERPDPGDAGRRLILMYLLLFTAVLVNHERRMGYLSHRHVLTLVLASLPWAAAAVDLCARRASGLLRLEPRTARVCGAGLIALAVSTGVWLQSKPPHPSRWGFWAAGKWVNDHAAPGDALLDTRGWAAFVAGRPSYDYWHVRQALTDSNLAYVIVSEDELAAPSRRAKTLNALLAYAAEPAATFPEREGESGVGVRVFRFHRPDSWESIRP